MVCSWMGRGGRVEMTDIINYKRILPSVDYRPASFGRTRLSVHSLSYV